jgi:phosphatidylserine decarboxylase
VSHEGAAYIDRRDGRVKTDPIYAAAFLDWCYNARSGQLLTRHVLSRRFASALYGWYYKRSWTRAKIASFAAALNVNLDELVQPLNTFSSFNDFICRRIDLSKRVIDRDPRTIISPVDGRLLAYPVVDLDQTFQIKSALFNLRRLLADDELGRRYRGGAMVILRLYLADYHHFHFPDSGTPGAPRFVSGRYFAVSPYSRRWAVPFYAENHRVMTRFASDAFGSVAVIEIGAFTVGSIRQTFVPHVRVSRGDRKGYFELGASIVVLVFEPGTIRLDDDLCRNTQTGLETFVRLGERIGCRT